MTQKEEGLKRTIGIFGLTANLVNYIIGAGIFALPAIIAEGLGSASIFAYLFCGRITSYNVCYTKLLRNLKVN